MSVRPTVFVVDDDEDTCQAVKGLVESVGLRAATCESAESFLRNWTPQIHGCVVLDVRLRHMSGLALHERLNEGGHIIPVIFLTAHADVQVVVRSMKAGAFDFFEKPYRDEALLERIQQALAYDRMVRSRDARLQETFRRLASLTAREREVTAFVVDGLTSRQIAARLELSPKTIHAHRAEAMAKLEARSVAELTRIVVGARLFVNQGAGLCNHGGGILDSPANGRAAWPFDQHEPDWTELPPTPPIWGRRISF